MWSVLPAFGSLNYTSRQVHGCQEPIRSAETPITFERWKMLAIYCNKCRPDSLNQIGVPGWGFLHRREMFTERLNFCTVSCPRKNRTVIYVVLPVCFMFQVINMDAYNTHGPNSFWIHLSMKCWHHALPVVWNLSGERTTKRKVLSLFLAHVPESCWQADETEKGVSCSSVRTV